jgi:tetratricopeptide (TPR) repeat protein
MTKKDSNDTARSQAKRSDKKRRSHDDTLFFRSLKKLVFAASYPQRRVKQILDHWRIGSFLGKLTGFVGRVFKFSGREISVRQADGVSRTRSWPKAQTWANPIWWVRWSASLIWRWLASRKFAPALGAFPAIALIGVLLAVSLTASRVSSVSLVSQNRATMARAVENGQFQLARIAADSVIKLTNANRFEIYNRAVLEQRAGNSSLAIAMMKELAVKGGVIEAALWLAQRVGDLNELNNWSDSQKTEYLQWIRTACDIEPTKSSPRRMLGDVLRSLGDFQGAYNAMLPIADESVENTFIVAFLEKQLGMLEKARERGEHLERVFKDRLSRNEQNFEIRNQYAGMLFLLDRVDDVIPVLNRGLELSTDATQIQMLRAGIADAMVVQAQKRVENDSSPRALIESLKLLTNAMNYDASNARLQEAITNACLKAAESDNDELTSLREAVVQGIHPDTAHFILGTIAINEGKLEEAIQHLEIAAKNNPGLPGLLNNLAHGLSNRESPDLERALRMAEAAVHNVPNHPYLRETRGQIYFKLGRYTEAIADLEIALSAAELRPSIRRSLAEAYDKIGQPDIAKRQLELLDKGR